MTDNKVDLVHESNVYESPTIDSLIEDFKKRIREEFDRDGTLMTQATLAYPDKEEKLHLIMMAMPSVSDEMARAAMKDLALKHHACLAMFASEVWVAYAKTDEELVRALRDKRNNTIDQRPDREEAVVIMIETMNEFEHHQAPIIREGNTVKLGELEEGKIKLPYPGWKRYLPMTRQ